jgi:hypothetical protein
MTTGTLHAIEPGTRTDVASPVADVLRSSSSQRRW